MRLNPSPVPLMPLRGPLGERELFCSGDTSPILRPFKPTRDERLSLLGVFLATVPGAWLYSCFLETTERHPPDLSDMFEITVNLWALTELISIGTLIVCYRRKGLRNLERRGRFAELALSPTRPVEIAQFAFIHDMQLMRGYALALYGGIVFAIPAFLPEMIPYSVPLGFLAINQLRSMQHAMWLEVAAFLSSENYLQHFRTVIAGGLAYLSWILPAVCVACAYRRTFDIDEPFLAAVGLLLGLAAWCWTVQYFFARGWAARIEQAIFHRIEF